ncbi:putative NRPS-like protein biosynthetic cluster [Onygenales sp. PD_10]|nr:putative NRPS-like protein biosynthetic cluster [Onygenales sp. PD_10]
MNGTTVATNDVPRTVYELIQQRAIHDPDLPLIAYPEDNVANVFVHYTSKDLAIYSSRVAKHYASLIAPRRKSSDPARVVALLAPPTIDYLISTLALSRIGFTVLFMSTRLSDSDFVSLLNRTCCSNVVVGRAFLERISNIASQVSGGVKSHIIADSSIYSNGKVPPYQVDERFLDQDLNPDIETNNACWIIHSSGSTGPPKPVSQTHSAILRNSSDNFNMDAFITLPLFHSHGISSVFRGIASKKEVYLYSASLPLTGPRLVDIFKKYNFELFSGVPYALKLMAEAPDGIEQLSRMKLVTFGGSSCPEALGDQLVRQGVRLACHFGCTECGQLMTSVRPPDDNDWNYLRVTPRAEPFLRFEEQDSTGLYELVVLDGWPPKVAENRPDGSYATKDLFKKHPSRPGLWKLVGRLDDTLVMLNGEKAIPLQMEQSVRTNPYVTDAVVFGSGKPMLGMLVIASECAQNLKADEILDNIEEVVASANALHPSFAHIDRNMIRILPFDTAYPRTDKGTVIRAAFYAQFSDVVEQVYADAASASNDARTMTRPELEAFLHKTFAKLLDVVDAGHKLQNNSDLFALGLDSLQALRARGQIVRHIATHGCTVGQNVVFERPSIAALADYLGSLGSKSDIGGDETLASSETMRGLVEEYSSFAPHVAVSDGTGRRPGQGVIVVTGATGSLGAHLVSQLVRRPDVRNVCCLVRGLSTDHARVRVIESLKQRKLYSSLSPSELSKISALPSSFSEEYLGLEKGIYERLLAEVDTVVHLAWAVNFNLGLSSFESHIVGTHNLIQFCLSARSLRPARFYFASSIATIINTPAPASIPETIPDAAVMESFSNTRSSGYGQSKLVAELICSRAANLGMVCSVLRLGQIVGDSEHGIWNHQEAFPLIVQSAVTVGALPELDEQLSWLPVDTAAGSIVDLVFLQDRRNEVGFSGLFHLAHPTILDWRSDFLPGLRAAGLEFETVPPKEWVERLRTNMDPVANPPIKLLSFFEAKYCKDDKDGEIYLCTDLACSMSPTLHSAKPITHSLIAKMVGYWGTECWRMETKKIFSVEK